jgi:hypothetical protein
MKFLRLLYRKLGMQVRKIPILVITVNFLAAIRPFEDLCLLPHFVLARRLASWSKLCDHV